MRSLHIDNISGRLISGSYDTDIKVFDIENSEQQLSGIAAEFLPYVLRLAEHTTYGWKGHFAAYTKTDRYPDIGWALVELSPYINNKNYRWIFSHGGDWPPSDHELDVLDPGPGPYQEPAPQWDEQVVGADLWDQSRRWRFMEFKTPVSFQPNYFETIWCETRQLAWLKGGTNKGEFSWM